MPEDIGKDPAYTHVVIPYLFSRKSEVLFNQKEGLIPRSLLRNKLFQDMEEEIY